MAYFYDPFLCGPQINESPECAAYEALGELNALGELDLDGQYNDNTNKDSLVVTV